MISHFRVEKLRRPIRVPAACKIELRWAIICCETNRRLTAKRTRKEAEAEAARIGKDQCWICQQTPQLL